MMMVMNVLGMMDSGVHNIVTLLKSGANVNKTAPARFRGPGWKGLYRAYVRRLETLRAPLDLKLHFVAFVQALVPFTDNGAIMDEHVLTAVALNETITLGGVKPLYCPCFHGSSPFEKF
jgi:hypothetical protein